MMDPDTLERSFYTDVDSEIRTTDLPERFQLRSIPIKYVVNIKQNSYKLFKIYINCVFFGRLLI